MVENLENEIWKDVPEYEGMYKVSNMGRVMSCAKTWKSGTYGTVKEKPDTIYPISLDKNSYHVIILRKNNKSKGVTAHRVIAELFIPNPENKREVNHKNGIKRDNRVENLEWATPKENNHHAIKTGLIDIKKVGERTRNRLLGGGGNVHKEVLNTETGIYFYSAKEAARAYNIPYCRFSHKLCGRAVNDTPFIYV